MSFQGETRTQSRHILNSRPRSEEPIEETKFVWYLFEGDFEWRCRELSPGLEMLFLWPKEGGRLAKSYEPLEQTELFDQFSRLDSPESMVKFGNDYGWLGLDMNYEREGRGRKFLGEPITTWSRHITDMRIVLEIWDMIQADDVRALKAFIPVSYTHLTLPTTPYV